MSPEQREELKKMLKDNRKVKGIGHGDPYWNSVVDTVERFLDRHFKSDVS